MLHGLGQYAQHFKTLEGRYFLRDLQHAQRLATAAWGSDGSQWVGEWHTHPRGSLVPSQADFRSYLSHLDDDELRLARFLSIVVTIGSQGMLAAAWIVDRNVAQLMAIEVEEESDAY